MAQYSGSPSLVWRSLELLHATGPLMVMSCHSLADPVLVRVHDLHATRNFALVFPRYAVPHSIHVSYLSKYYRQAAENKASGSNNESLLSIQEEQGEKVQMKALVLVSIAICSSLLGITAVSQDLPGQHMPNPYEMLNIKAHAANADQSTSVEELTRAVMEYPHSIPIPPILGDLLVKRLSQAEVSYRRGQGQGIKEGDLVFMMNHLATKLALPSYALVTPSQIRVLRMGLLFQSPDLMAMGVSRSNMHVGDSIPDTLSPLQAMHIFQTMLDQKISSPEYQDPSIDLVSNMQQHRIQAEKARQAGVKSIPRATVTENPKSTEMRKALAAGTQSMSMQDAYTLVDEAFTTLKMK